MGAARAGGELPSCAVDEQPVRHKEASARRQGRRGFEIRDFRFEISDFRFEI
jgi:hypothetical protein